MSDQGALVSRLRNHKQWLIAQLKERDARIDELERERDHDRTALEAYRLAAARRLSVREAFLSEACRG